MRGCLLLLVLIGTPFFGQAPSPQHDVYRMGPGIIPPKLIHKVEPTYPQDALQAGIQGTVALEVTVNEHGVLTDISVLSPLGYGLDERAEEAIKQWRFEPGTKDGKPVKIRATIRVNFRRSGVSFDAKAEQRRTDFNVAIRDLQRKDEKSTASAVETIDRLANENLPAAIYLKAMWMREGKLVPRNDAELHQF